MSRDGERLRGVVEERLQVAVAGQLHHNIHVLAAVNTQREWLHKQ